MAPGAARAISRPGGDDSVVVREPSTPRATTGSAALGRPRRTHTRRTSRCEPPGWYGRTHVTCAVGVAGHHPLHDVRGRWFWPTAVPGSYYDRSCSRTEPPNLPTLLRGWVLARRLSSTASSRSVAGQDFEDIHGRRAHRVPGRPSQSGGLSASRRACGLEALGCSSNRPPGVPRTS